MVSRFFEKERTGSGKIPDLLTLLAEFLDIFQQSHDHACVLKPPLCLFASYLCQRNRGTAHLVDAPYA